MKNLIFESLELLSLTEKKARRVTFHPRLTVITGENRVGKSTLIKSIYWTLGASPKFHPKWKNVNAKGLLTFTIEGKRYQALRNGKTVAIFDGGGNLLVSTTSFTSELGPFIAELIDFKLILSSHEGIPQTPPPAYAFLPFYVDQDAGWSKPLSSFDRLTQYPNFRRSVVEFHSGIRPNKYYELTAEKKKLDIEKAVIEQDRAVVVKARDKLDLQVKFSGLELSADEHEKAINDLLLSLRSLLQTRQARAQELADVLDQRSALDQQISIVQASANELAEDAAWASAQDTAEIMCPTCGTVHANDFSNRFAILADREECFEFLNGAQKKRRGLARKVSELQAAVNHADARITEMQRALEDKRGEITLEDVIEAKGKAAARHVFEAEIKELENSIGEKAGQIIYAENGIKELNDPARRELIEGYYAGLMGAYMKNLNVQDADNDAVTKIAGNIVETGSEQPRLMLAYVLSLADTIQKFTSAFTAPLVIDSPVQQEQDMTNAPAIIRQVISVRPDGGQTIVGTISLHGNKPVDAKVITFSEKGSVLLESEYDAVFAKLGPMMSVM